MVSVKCDDRNMLTEDDVQIDKLQTQLVLSGNAVQSYDKKYFWIPCSLGVMVGIIQLIWYCVYKKCKKDSQYTLIIIFLTLVLLNPIFSIFQLINVPLSIILFECVDFFTFEFTSLLLIWILDEMFPKYSNNNCKLPKVGITASFWLVIVIWFLVSFGTSVLYCINYHSSFLLIKQHPLSFGTTASLIAISFLNHSNTISDSYIAIEILFRLCLIPIPIVYSRFAYHCFRLIRQTVYGFILVYNERKQEDNSSKTTYSNTQRCFPCKKQNEDNEIPRNEKEQEVDKEKEIDKQPTLDDIEKEADDWFSNEDNPFSREDDPFSSEDDPFSEKNDEKKKKQMSEEEKKGIFTNLDSQIIPEPLPKPANKSAGQ
ncbi:hypothetical protein SNEBB_003056 [Seison nebaliae]|nr:hypothetical protein SNEBB_003056 [Seison nebaliae]